MVVIFGLQPSLNSPTLSVYIVLQQAMHMAERNIKKYHVRNKSKSNNHQATYAGSRFKIMIRQHNFFDAPFVKIFAS